MPPLLTTILTTLITGFLIAIITARWNIEIKWSTSKEQVMKLWKSVVFWGLSILALSVQLCSFVMSVVSKEPITRLSIAIMIINGGGFAYNVLMLSIMLINKQLGRLWETIDKESDRTNRHLDITKEVAVYTKVVADQNLLVNKELHQLIQTVNDRINHVEEKIKLLEQKRLPPVNPPP